MKLSLTRWEDQAGSSQGHWIVKQLPGVGLVSVAPGDWAIITISSAGQVEASQDFISQKILERVRRGTRRGFTSRREALCYLETLTLDPPDSNLAELCGRLTKCGSLKSTL